LREIFIVLENYFSFEKNKYFSFSEVICFSENRLLFSQIAFGFKL